MKLSVELYADKYSGFFYPEFINNLIIWHDELMGEVFSQQSYNIERDMKTLSLLRLVIDKNMKKFLGWED